MILQSLGKAGNYGLLKKFTKNGITHLVLGVGKTYYPFPSDFLEEARRMGVSKKVPRNFPFDELTPGKSRMLLNPSEGLSTV